MLINKSQAILKRFIDLKFSVWFTLGSEDETMFCDTELFSGGQGPVQHSFMSESQGKKSNIQYLDYD